MAWSTAEVPSLRGRVAVITGANGGLGYETAKALAAAGAHVVSASRDATKAADARTRILASVPDASVEVVPLDLGSLESIAAAAATVTEAHPVIDILVNNAGVMALPEQRTADGFEMQFGVDHLGHWALTSRLLPVLLAAPAARVVTVTSTAHHYGRAVDPSDPHLRRHYGPWRAYGQAKLANYHFGIGLERRFRAAGLTARSLIAHPGFTHTELQRRSAREQGGAGARFFSWAVARSGMTPAQGARSQIRAATDPAATGFYGPRYMNWGPPVRLPILRRIGMDRAIAVLWEVSRRETGLDVDPAAVARGVGA